VNWLCGRIVRLDYCCWVVVVLFHYFLNGVPFGLIVGDADGVGDGEYHLGFLILFLIRYLLIFESLIFHWLTIVS